MKNMGLFDMINETEPSDVDDKAGVDLIDFVNDLLDEYYEDIDEEMLTTIETLLFRFEQNPDSEALEEVIIDLVHDNFDFDFEDEPDDVVMDEKKVEEVAKLKKKRDWQAKRKNKISYMKNRRKIAVKAKRYRQTGKFKKYIKKSKKMNKMGKTSSGKRQTTFMDTKRK